MYLEANGYNTLVKMKTYSPTNVTLELSRTWLGRLCDTRFQSTVVRVIADGIDVTSIAEIGGTNLFYDSSLRTLRPVATGVHEVLVAGVVHGSVNASPEVVQDVKLRASAINRISFRPVHHSLISASLSQVLTDWLPRMPTVSYAPSAGLQLQSPKVLTDCKSKKAIFV